MPNAGAIVAISAANSAQSAHAAAEAHRARVTACRVMTSGYTDTAATVEQRQTYADCVDVLWPRETGPEGVLVIKALIMAAIVGLLIGAWRGFISGYDRFADAFIGGFFGLCVGPFMVGLLYGGWWGIQFLVA